MLLDGVPLEAPLTGTILLFENNDQPGVVGQLGTMLGKHGINIANFSLGRTESGSAVGAVQLDEPKTDSGSGPDGNSRDEAAQGCVVGACVRP